MLQGSPFETELAVKDNMMRVRQGIEPKPETFRFKARVKVQQWTRTLVSSLHMPSYDTSYLEAAEDKQ
jgi:hypothetical protein